LTASLCLKFKKSEASKENEDFGCPDHQDAIQDRTRKLHRAVCNEVIWKVRKCSVQTGTQIHEPAEVKNPFHHRQTNCCCCLPDESHQEGSQEASQNSGVMEFLII
jgi:hypothetical protein